MYHCIKTCIKVVALFYNHYDPSCINHNVHCIKAVALIIIIMFHSIRTVV